jgi:hypothetical protein
MRAAAIRLAAVALCVALLPSTAHARKGHRGRPGEPEKTVEPPEPDRTERTIEPPEPDKAEPAERTDETTTPAKPETFELPPPPPPDPPPPILLAPSASEPALGFSDRPYVRTAGGDITLYPSVLLQVDGVAFTRQTPKSGAFLRRARVGMAGWIGRAFYFDLAVETAPAPPDLTAVAPSVVPAADAYLALAPAGDLFILQVGQFDIPFTLENRTRDAYTDFIERAMVARSLGAPRNKEVGDILKLIIFSGQL